MDSRPVLGIAAVERVVAELDVDASGCGRLGHQHDETDAEPDPDEADHDRRGRH